MKNTG